MILVTVRNRFMVVLVSVMWRFLLVRSFFLRFLQSSLSSKKKKQVRWRSRLVLGVFASYSIRRQKESYSKHRDDVHKPLETVSKKECCNWNKYCWKYV
jgi:hypothetical protein